MNRNYACFTNRDCEFFPCHKGISEENFNCLFCFCPLYVLGTNCGGAYRILDNGCKDCTLCTYPHERKNYDAIMGRFPEIVDVMKKLEN